MPIQYTSIPIFQIFLHFFNMFILRQLRIMFCAALPEASSGRTNRPDKPARQAGQTSRPDKPARQAGQTSRPDKPARQTGQTNRPDKPDDTPGNPANQLVYGLGEARFAQQHFRPCAVHLHFHDVVDIGRHTGVRL